MVRGQGSRIFHLVFITYKFHIFESNFEAISFPIFYKDPEAVQKRKTKHAHTFCGGEREREKNILNALPSKTVLILFEQLTRCITSNKWAKFEHEFFGVAMIFPRIQSRKYALSVNCPSNIKSHRNWCTWRETRRFECTFQSEAECSVNVCACVCLCDEQREKERWMHEMRANCIAVTWEIL